MKGNLIAMALNMFGLGWVWEKIDGAKTYLGASVEILTGFGGVLLAASALVQSFLNTATSLGGAINFVQDQMAHPSAPVIAITISWAAVIHGWGVMAKKSSDDKKHDELVAATAAAAAPVVVAPAAVESAPVAPAADESKK